MAATREIQRTPRADALRSVDAILVAAREVLSEDAAAGIDVIAARARVHRATLYRHFPTREALVSGLYEAYLDDAEATILETDVNPADPLAEIEALTRRVYDVNLAWRAFAWAPAYSLETQARRAEMAMTTYALFGAAHDAGVLRADLSVRELLAAWGAPILFMASRISEGAWTLDEVVAHTMRLLTAPGA